MIKARVEEITPEIAAAMLAHSPEHQRGVKERYAASLAQAMRRGEWVVNGESIVVDEEGHTIDGQHRLRAVVASGVTIYSLVVRGVSVSRDVFATLNVGKSRSLADVIKIDGCGRGWDEQRLAAVLRALCMHGPHSNYSMSYREVVSSLPVYADGLDAIATACPPAARSHGNKVVTATVIAAVTAAVLHGHDISRCASFLDGLRTGVVDDARGADSAAITVRNALLSSSLSYAERLRSFRRAQRALVAFLAREPWPRAVCPDRPVWDVSIGSEWWRKRNDGAA